MHRTTSVKSLPTIGSLPSVYLRALAILIAFGSVHLQVANAEDGHPAAIPVFSSPPQAVPNDAQVGQSILFSAAADAATGLGYFWDFGDGTTSTGAIATHTYGAAGVYTATIVVKSESSKLTGSVFVTINPVVSQACVSFSPASESRASTGSSGKTRTVLAATPFSQLYFDQSGFDPNLPIAARLTMGKKVVMLPAWFDSQKVKLSVPPLFSGSKFVKGQGMLSFVQNGTVSNAFKVSVGNLPKAPKSTGMYYLSYVRTIQSILASFQGTIKDTAIASNLARTGRAFTSVQSNIAGLMDRPKGRDARNDIAALRELDRFVAGLLRAAAQDTSDSIGAACATWLDALENGDDAALASAEDGFKQAMLSGTTSSRMSGRAANAPSAQSGFNYDRFRNRADIIIAGASAGAAFLAYNSGGAGAAGVLAEITALGAGMATGGVILVGALAVYKSYQLTGASQQTKNYVVGLGSAITDYTVDKVTTPPGFLGSDVQNVVQGIKATANGAKDATALLATTPTDPVPSSNPGGTTTAGKFLLTIVITGNGTATDTNGNSWSSGSNHYVLMGNDTVVAHPFGGEVFDHWTIDQAKVTTPSATVKMDRDKTIFLVFSNFNGNYKGTFDGALSGTVAFSVNGGSITVSEPGSGQGLIAEDGTTSFGGGSLGVKGQAVTFSGQFILQGGSAFATGAWKTADGSAIGTWSASRQ